MNSAADAGTLDPPMLLHIALALTGLTETQLAAWVFSRDQKSLQNWKHGKTMPETAQRTLRWLIALDHKRRDALVALLAHERNC